MSVINLAAANWKKWISEHLIAHRQSWQWSVAYKHFFDNRVSIWGYLRYCFIVSMWPRLSYIGLYIVAHAGLPAPVAFLMQVHESFHESYRAPVEASNLPCCGIFRGSVPGSFRGRFRGSTEASIEAASVDAFVEAFMELPSSKASVKASVKASEEVGKNILHRSVRGISQRKILRKLPQ